MSRSPPLHAVAVRVKPGFKDAPLPFHGEAMLQLFRILFEGHVRNCPIFLMWNTLTLSVVGFIVGSYHDFSLLSWEVGLTPRCKFHSRFNGNPWLHERDGGDRSQDRKSTR